MGSGQSLIRDKFFLRSIIASIPTILLYTLGYFGAKLAEVEAPFEYFDQLPWAIIAAVSFIWPINRIPLMILFEPLVWLCNRRIMDNDRTPDKNPILLGNFKSCRKEDKYEVLDIVHGKVPTDINGVYLRNGPDHKHHPSTERIHWFDGDAMIHAFRIKAGKVYYCNRYAQTPRVQQETAYGKALNVRFGELFCLSGFVKFGLFSLQKKIGYKPYLEDFKKDLANTAFVHHEKRTYAVHEADLPFHIKIDRSEKQFDIKSIGHDDFEGQLKHQVSAHPRVDRRNGELLAFGYSPEGSDPCIHYSLFTKDRKLINSMKVPLEEPRMIHDFACTETYAIMPNNPLTFDFKNVEEGKFIFRFDKTKPSKYGIMKRLNQDPSKIQWFEFPAHYVFHFVNSWEEKNDQGQDIVTVWGCAQHEVNIDFHEEHPFHGNFTKAILSKMTFNMSTGESKIQDDYLKDMSVEFPVVPQQDIGYKTRYTYIAKFFDKPLDTQVGRDSQYFEGFIKFDLQEEKLAGYIPFGKTKTSGEVFFYQRDNATSIDDGYCMCFVWDWETEESEFVMWDAKTMDETPVFRARTKARVPHGFHTFFVHEDELEE